PAFRAAVIVGALRSTLTPLTVMLVEFPAWSVAVPVTDWPAPSPSVVGPLTVASGSVVPKLTVGAPVAMFHQPPKAASLFPPWMALLIVGATVSWLTPVTA